MEPRDVPNADLPDFDNRYFRDYQIYTSPNRPGYLPIGRTQSYEHLKSGRFPKPDLRIGKSLRWRPSTVEAWVAEKMAG